MTRSKDAQNSSEIRGELGALSEPFSVLAEKTAREAQAVDLRARLDEALESETDRDSGHARPTWRKRWILFPLTAAACAVLAFAALRDGGLASSDRSLMVSGPATAFAGLRGGDGIEVGVMAMGVSLPARLVAGDSGSARMTFEGGSVRLWPGSEIAFATPTRIVLLAGGASVATKRNMVFETAVGPVRGRGVFDIELAKENRRMTLTRNHKIGGAVAIAVAVVAGYVILPGRDGDKKVDGPDTAVVDNAGRVTSGLSGPRGDGLAGKDTASTPSGEGDVSAVASVSGAFWDEAQQRIVFALAGEVVDATTGDPIRSFDLSANVTSKSGFGQKEQNGRVRRSFSGKKDGRFVLNNLGLGRWEVEVRAEGYAPSRQSVDLSDLHANPLLLFPLSEGAQITGQVLDWKGEPVADALVGQPECMPRSRKAGDAPRSRKGCVTQTTDKDGAFTLPTIPEERIFSLRAEHKKYGFADIKNLKQAEGSTEHVVIRLSGVVRMFGSVTRGADQNPVAGAVVASKSGESAKTNITGNYEILAPLHQRPEAFVESDPARARGRAKIASYPDSRSSRELRWVDADTHVAEVEIDFRLQMESGTIVGRIIDNAGKPMVGVELNFANTAGWKGKRGHQTYPTRAVTDDGGNYRVDDVPAEAGYRVAYKVGTDDGSERWNSLGFVRVPEEREVVANFTVGGGAIRGRFVDDKGETFMASDRGCSRLGARSGADVFVMPKCLGEGRFEFVDLPPGKYVLENRIGTHNSPIEITPQTVELGADEVKADVEVVASGEPAVTWKMRILDAEGRFVSGTFLRYTKGKTSFTSNLQIGDDGIAEINLSREFSEINIDAPGFVSEAVSLNNRPPNKTIEIRLTRAPK